MRAASTGLAASTELAGVCVSHGMYAGLCTSFGLYRAGRDMCVILRLRVYVVPDVPHTQQAPLPWGPSVVALVLASHLAMTGKDESDHRGPPRQRRLLGVRNSYAADSITSMADSDHTALPKQHDL